ncbi:hypothetical protein D3C87_1533020 [compost metagenome]
MARRAACPHRARAVHPVDPGIVVGTGRRIPGFRIGPEQTRQFRDDVSCGDPLPQPGKRAQSRLVVLRPVPRSSPPEPEPRKRLGAPEPRRCTAVGPGPFPQREPAADLASAWQLDDRPAHPSGAGNFQLPKARTRRGIRFAVFLPAAVQGGAEQPAVSQPLPEYAAVAGRANPQAISRTVSRRPVVAPRRRRQPE